MKNYNNILCAGVCNPLQSGGSRGFCIPGTLYVWLLPCIIVTCIRISCTLYYVTWGGNAWINMYISTSRTLRIVGECESKPKMHRAYNVELKRVCPCGIVHSASWNIEDSSEKKCENVWGKWPYDQTKNCTIGHLRWALTHSPNKMHGQFPSSQALLHTCAGVIDDLDALWTLYMYMYIALGEEVIACTHAVVLAMSLTCVHTNMHVCIYLGSTEVWEVVRQV